MTEHPAANVIELLAIGALEDDDEVVAHCSTCDACAAALAREARLELALGEVHAFRVAPQVKLEKRKTAPRLVWIAPIAVFAAAAAILFIVRRGPKPGVLAEPAIVVAPAVASTPAPSDVADVVATLRPGFRKCYQAGLAAGGATDGRVVLATTVAPDGSVRDVVATSLVGLSAEVASCMVAVVRGAQFAGTGATTTINIPVAFVAQR